MKKIKSSIKLLLKNLKPLISKIEIPEENARETKEK